MITVGLVAEGTHDFIMLRPLISAELKKRGIEEIQFRALQPTPDETGKMSEGGWTKVLAWCQTYNGMNIETFFTPLFAGDPPCDVIIIHMDGDALECVEPHTTKQIPENPPITERVAVVVDILEEWLSTPKERKSKIAFAVPVLQTEAWILAVEDGSKSYHDVDAKSEFRKTHSGRGRFEAYYMRKVTAACTGEFQLPTCPSYRAFAELCAGVEIGVT